MPRVKMRECNEMSNDLINYKYGSGKKMGNLLLGFFSRHTSPHIIPVTN